MPEEGPGSFMQQLLLCSPLTLLFVLAHLAHPPSNTPHQPYLTTPGPVAEQVLLLENIATSIKTGPNQLPTIHNLLLEAVSRRCGSSDGSCCGLMLHAPV